MLRLCPASHLKAAPEAPGQRKGELHGLSKGCTVLLGLVRPGKSLGQAQSDSLRLGQGDGLEGLSRAYHENCHKCHWHACLSSSSVRVSVENTGRHVSQPCKLGKWLNLVVEASTLTHRHY